MNFLPSFSVDSMRTRILLLASLLTCSLNGSKTWAFTLNPCAVSSRSIPSDSTCMDSLPPSFFPPTHSRCLGGSLSMVSSPIESIEFSADDLLLLEEIHASEKGLAEALQERLSTLPSDLVVRLRQASHSEHEIVRTLSAELNRLLDDRLLVAKETLEDLLEAGEIRKLDALIGKAARENKLDVAFFNVLSANLKEAMEATGEGGPEEAASRLQILQHVYTRCQEEMEKSIPPGLALLNKLLRQPQESIRKNLYEHYLSPQKNVVTTPDGKQIELQQQGGGSTLVSLDDFVSAISQTVLQIRTVEKSGATDRASAATMVESCRQVAKEARVIIGESYGIDSKELEQFQQGLQPVFRPSSADSPFIQGQ